MQHLEEFAKEGLRTLCLGVTTIPVQQYEEWNRKWVLASTAVSDREELLGGAGRHTHRD